MTRENSNPPPVNDGWDTYWPDARATAAFSSGDSIHPLFLSFWSNYFREAQKTDANLKIIDIACGNGAIVECAHTVFSGRLPEFTCLDRSESAIRMVEKRFPTVRGIVADAAAIPLESRSFRSVISQFGVEYAGHEGILEAARLVAVGGDLTLVLHCNPGVIFTECSTSLYVIDRLRQARFFPLAKAMFKAGFSTSDVASSRTNERARRKFKPAFRLLERMLLKHGEGVASGLISRLRDDIERISRRLNHYEQREVFVWLDQLNNELTSYRRRMKSMTDAAVNSGTLDIVGRQLIERGFTLTAAMPLGDQTRAAQFAWSLSAVRITANPEVNWASD